MIYMFSNVLKYVTSLNDEILNLRLNAYYMSSLWFEINFTAV